MPDAKKVIKGLECCCVDGMARNCEECPYAEQDGTCYRIDPLLHDALALLKAQEPRVMTLDEYKVWADTPFCERDPIFHEMKLRRGPVTWWTNTAECSIENYGKTERCWTSRPTDKQRERSRGTMQNIEHTGDRISVVRCRDCKHWCRCGDSISGTCGVLGGLWDENEFCSDGERRENNG